MVGASAADFFLFFFSFWGRAAAPAALRGRDTSTGSVQQLSFATVISVSRSTTYRDQRSPAVEPHSRNVEVQTSESDRGPAGEGRCTGWGGAEDSVEAKNLRHRVQRFWHFRARFEASLRGNFESDVVIQLSFILI